MKYVPLRTFATSTAFGFDPERIGVVESLYTGCIELHLTGYDSSTQVVKPGGSGLRIQGQITQIGRFDRVENRLVIVDGFDEVFQVVTCFDGVIVLRPLGIGLGVRSQLAMEYRRRQPRTKRQRKKYATLAQRYLAGARVSIRNLTGSVPGRHRAATGPFILREWSKRWSQDTVLDACTLEEAKVLARARIAQLRSQRWKCGEEAPQRGEIQRETGLTVWWLCLRGGQEKRVSIEACAPRQQEKLSDHSFGCNMTAREIAEARDTWNCFPGFTADSCHNCLADVNVLAGGGGWFCNCGDFNMQCTSDHTIPHQHPDYGPSLATIRASHQFAKS